MADFILTPTAPLGSYRNWFGPVKLEEQVDLAIVSLAIPLDGGDAAARAIKAAWDMDLPNGGATTVSADGMLRLVSSGAEQYLALFTHPTPDAARHVRTALGASVYITDQTDNWAKLMLSGPRVREALERICPIDLDERVFAVGAAARTMMEHMGAFILRTGDDDFLVLVGMSSARSMLHALEQSLAWTVAD